MPSLQLFDELVAHTRVTMTSLVGVWIVQYMFGFWLTQSMLRPAQFTFGLTYVVRASFEIRKMRFMWWL